ncbi:MAG: hypothetical protein Q8N23_18095 [Archangium sp.]|nr:hypothetical protein [Archangium sp.]MDP3574346.1 hypothetical protein [Archangium sp.]
MATEAWAINGHRIERHTEFLGPGRLVVLDAAGVQQTTLPLTRGNEWELPIGARTWQVFRLRLKDALGRSVERFNILSERGALVPPGAATLAQPIDAAPDSRCATHAEVAAVRVCVRCGSFMCEPCLAADAVHCAPCFAPVVERHGREQSAAFWAAPALVFVYFGLIGVVFGSLAAGASMAYARRVPKEKFSAWVPAGFYGAAILAGLGTLHLLRR